MNEELINAGARTGIARAERDHWIKLFNRLEAAVRRHIDSKVWNDADDDQLHASYKAVLKDAVLRNEPDGD